jgi:integrase
VANNLGVLRKIPISKITPLDLSRYVNELLERGNTPKTAKNKYAVISVLLKFAVKLQLIKSAPTGIIMLPKVHKQEMATLQTEEIICFLTNVKPHYKLLAATLVFTGMRFGEATALMKKDFDPQNSLIYVRRSWSENGKKISVGKTPSARRIVPIPQQLSDAIQELVENCHDDDFIFVNLQGGQITHSMFDTAIIKAKKILIEKYSKKIRVHDLRHTYASILLFSNLPIVEVSKILGHKSISTTVDVYGHFEPKNSNHIENTFRQFNINSLIKAN